MSPCNGASGLSCIHHDPATSDCRMSENECDTEIVLWVPNEDNQVTLQETQPTKFQSALIIAFMRRKYPPVSDLGKKNL